MSLPIPTSFAPMEADSAKAIPSGPEWQYEPKWDGFRCLCFREGLTLDIRSKSSQPLARYFPEIRQALLDLEPQTFVVDGEVIITQERSLDFDALLQRIHPAESRIRKLAKETPATLMLFDLLVDERGENLTGEMLEVRRERLESFSKRFVSGNKSIRLSPRTRDFDVAKNWFHRMAGPLDGVIAKRVDKGYASGERKAMLKIKNLRTADCVVGGFRYGSKERVVGSLLLGLYDSAALLNHVGFSSGLAIADKQELTKKLEGLVRPPGFTGLAPGGPSRWSTERSTEWQPLSPELVVEVQYDHFSGHRFRHGTKLLRWRPDKAPAKCTMTQIVRESESPLTLLD